MSEVQVLKPQKTWSHLVARRRKPSEYEIVSAHLHYTDRDPDSPSDLAPAMFTTERYTKNTFGTALQHADWNAFRDPDEVVCRTLYYLPHASTPDRHRSCWPSGVHSRGAPRLSGGMPCRPLSFELAM